MRALVTGFAPFGGDAINASYAAVARLPEKIGALEITTALLPTSFARAADALLAEIARVKPALVVCVGEAGERYELNIERVAINVQDARIADNDGAQPVDTAIVAGGEAAYFSTLPVRAIVKALARAQLPAVISNSAGTFVCNHLFYTLMHHAARTRRKFSAGFIHVPAWRADAEAHAMLLDDIARGLAIALETCAAQ